MRSGDCGCNATVFLEGARVLADVTLERCPLHASAPDLLAKATLVADLCVGIGLNIPAGPLDDAMNDLRAAIAKATGTETTDG